MAYACKPNIEEVEVGLPQKWSEPEQQKETLASGKIGRIYDIR